MSTSFEMNATFLRKNKKAIEEIVNLIAGSKLFDFNPLKIEDHDIYSEFDLTYDEEKFFLERLLSNEKFHRCHNNLMKNENSCLQYMVYKRKFDTLLSLAKDSIRRIDEIKVFLGSK